MFNKRKITDIIDIDDNDHQPSKKESKESKQVGTIELPKCWITQFPIRIPAYKHDCESVCWMLDEYNANLSIGQRCTCGRKIENKDILKFKTRKEISSSPLALLMEFKTICGKCEEYSGTISEIIRHQEQKDCTLIRCKNQECRKVLASKDEINAHNDVCDFTLIQCPFNDKVSISIFFFLQNFDL